MKKKVLLKSVAVMMSLLTLAPCFGNMAFAMKRNKNQVVMKQVVNEEETLKNEFKELVKTFVDQKKATNKEEFEKFRKKINDNKLFRMCSSDDNANTRLVIYLVILAYLIEKNYFHFEINLYPILDDKIICCADTVRKLFVMLDTTLRIYFSEDNSILDSLASLRADLFKINGYLQVSTFYSSLQNILDEENEKIERFNRFSNDNDRKDVQTIFAKIVSFHDSTINIGDTFSYLFGLFQNGFRTAEWCKSVAEELIYISKLGNFGLCLQSARKLRNLQEHTKAVALKYLRPVVETINKKQEQKREEEKERSRDTKPNAPTGMIEPNYSELGMLLKDEKEKEEEAFKKAEGRKQAKEIEVNRQRKKEKEREDQERQEEIERQREEQKLPSDDLTDAEINSIFAKKSNGVSPKKSKYTKIFTAEKEDGIVNTVYFPFDLLNKVQGNKRQQKTIKTNIKRMIYNISRLPENEFKRLSLDTYTGTTHHEFLKEHFTQNAQECFTNSNPENVYRFKIHNKCQVVFVKKGNEIVVLDSLEHIGNGLQ